MALMLGNFEAFWGDFRQISSTSGLKWPKVLRSRAVGDYHSKEYWSCSKSCHARTNITNVLSIAPYIWTNSRSRWFDHYDCYYYILLLLQCYCHSYHYHDLIYMSLYIIYSILFHCEQGSLKDTFVGSQLVKLCLVAQKTKNPPQNLVLGESPQKYSLVLTALSPTIMLKVEMYKSSKQSFPLDI